MFANSFVLALLLAMHFLAAPQKADISFGHAQVEQVICDRPEMGAVINRMPALREVLESCFAGALAEERVYWDCREPLNEMLGGHIPSYRDYPALIRVSNRPKVSAIDRCAILLIELNHSQFENNHKALDLMAIRKQMTRNDFAKSNLRLESQAVKKAQEFFRKHPISDANSESDPYYTSVMERYGEFSDYLQWQESPDSKKHNLLQYYLHEYDRMLSESTNGIR